MSPAGNEDKIMIKINTLVLGDYQTNCYIVRDSEDACVVIDPGYEPDTVLAQVKRLGLKIQAILLTHGHFDHVGGVQAIAQTCGCPVYMAPEDLKLPAFMTRPMGPTTDIADGDVLELAGVQFRVLHTPGHTQGSVCFLTERALFSGDTLFAGSCGRTDLPGGDMVQMQQSLARLEELDFHGHVLSGHGPKSTMAEERAYNPYLTGADA